MQEQKKEVSWAIVIIFLILFWPVGLILLLVKLFQKEDGQISVNNLNDSLKRISNETANFFKPRYPIIISCESCGAKNTVKPDQITKCAYCNTPQPYPNK